MALSKLEGGGRHGSVRASIGRTGGILSTTIIVVWMLAFAVSSAQASFEKVETFGQQGHAGELGEEATGVAVDEASGDVYVASGQKHSVLRFNGKGNFLEEWGWGVADGLTEAFQRCGPEGEVVYPMCTEGEGRPGEGTGQFISPQGIAVDQTTGNVYVLDVARKNSVIQVFNPDGKELIASFGERGSKEKSEQIKNPRKSIAVDSLGDVYIVDEANGEAKNARVMVFRPKAGSQYKEYEYASGGDLAVGFNPGYAAIDLSGNLYVSNNEDVYKFAANNLGMPAWKFEKKCNIEGMTVNSKTGEVFFYCSQGETFYRLSSEGNLEEEFKGASGEKRSEG